MGKRDDDFGYRPHVEQTTQEGLDADIDAALVRLRDAGYDAIFTVGFCFGGRQSWLATTRQELAGAAGLYGRPGIGRDGSLGPTQRAEEIRAPILGLMGGADAGIPAEDVDEFDLALIDAGIEHELVTYDGAPHSFFDRKQGEFAEASADAWSRVLGFVERYSSRSLVS